MWCNRCNHCNHTKFTLTRERFYILILVLYFFIYRLYPKIVVTVVTMDTNLLFMRFSQGFEVVTHVLQVVTQKANHCHREQ